ncbi:hypothetical protein jhhlp_000940 [Lomentospora prolificans]|uniref:Uncharacterized protein n=1 Tax=Lomentospora prolificans TaxID=41688 RepID=A0A2N3NK53_9PEZI|nr:hypothetical protein jhhlp_000940 [Lomentospora prolificans]
MLWWYQSVLARRPVLTQSVTTAILNTIGDITAQQVVEKRGKDHDWKRTARMTLYGGVVFGPCAAMWYRFLTHRVVFKNKNAEVLARVAVDQTVFSPTFLTVFLSTMAYLEGRSPQENVKKNFLPIMATNYMVWPWVQLANFKYVPLNHRLTFANTVAIGWNCYISYMNNRDI